jgi:hypothetical protein
MSAELVVTALRDLSNNKELDRYDENLCADIQKRLDSKLKERNMSISEKSIFVNINFRFFVNIHDFFLLSSILN